MNIYQDEGWLDLRKIYRVLTNMDIWFCFMIGGRGTGKTYGALEMVVEDEKKFLLMRRQQTETDMINEPEFSPFKKLNSKKDWNVYGKKIAKYNSGLYLSEEEDEEGSPIIAGPPIGYTCALSTISNMRGFDASDCDILVYDEFIKEKHARKIQFEATAFFNAVESINRNRELEGEKPIFTLGLANSNDIANDIFIELGIVAIISKMRQKGNEVYINRERSLCIIDVQKSDISERKKEQALYKLTKGTDFARMALENSFNGENASVIKSKPLREYLPVVMIGELCIYEHKSTKMLYASLHQAGKMAKYGIGEIEKARFINHYRWIWYEHLDSNIEFESQLCEILLTKVFK